MTLFAYPKQAAFGRVLPKSKIYEWTQPAKGLKDLFVRQVEQIVWQFNLTPETINVKGTLAVPEIQVFSIILKDGELKPEVLRCIDQAISFPIIFELHFEEKIKFIAAYKRPNEADTTKWVISKYFSTDWLADNAVRQALPIVFDFEALYAKLLAPLLPYPPRPGESLKEQVERMEQIELMQRELEQCEVRLGKEKQFNRKVEINGERRELRQALSKIMI